MRILAVGGATLDIVSLIDAYPAEDAEVRAMDQRISRGGNATNTLVVLSQLGHKCYWGGVLGRGFGAQYILNDLEKNNIDISHVIRSDAETPISCVSVSRQGCSRTIVHYRNLPEFSERDFLRINTADFDWMHFEGRNPLDLKNILQRANNRTKCSLEIEKPREGIESLFPFAGLLLFSSGYARHCGFQDGATFLSSIKRRVSNGTQMTCAWGEQGAWGMDREGFIHHSPACSPPQTVDTLGAGDVFNAAIIHGAVGGDSMKNYLAAACRLAGQQCGRVGLKLGQWSTVEVGIDGGIKD